MSPVKYEHPRIWQLSVVFVPLAENLSLRSDIIDHINKNWPNVDGRA
jgi:hypothetical protein